MPAGQHADTRNISCDARGAAFDARCGTRDALRATGSVNWRSLSRGLRRANRRRRSNKEKTSRRQHATGASWRESVCATRGRRVGGCRLGASVLALKAAIALEVSDASKSAARLREEVAAYYFCLNAPTHARTHTRTHAHARTHSHSHTHSHKHARCDLPELPRRSSCSLSQ